MSRRAADGRRLWLLRHPHVSAVAFEDLVGPDGGGTRTRQTETVHRLADHLGVAVDATELAAVADRAFDSAAHTFRRGRVGGWREHFTPAVTALFEERYAGLARLYGYPG